MPQFNARRVNHKYIGTTQTFDDSTVWRQLKIGSSVKGSIAAKIDLINGFAYLLGVVTATFKSGDNSQIIAIPDSDFKFKATTYTAMGMSNERIRNGFETQIVSVDSSGNLITTKHNPYSKTYTSTLMFFSGNVNMPDSLLEMEDWTTLYQSDPVKIPIIRI